MIKTGFRVLSNTELATLPRKVMFQPPLSMGPEDDHVTLLLICSVQDLFSRVAFLDDDLGYEIDTWRANLGLYVLTELLQQLLDLGSVLLLLFFFIL